MLVLPLGLVPLVATALLVMVFVSLLLPPLVLRSALEVVSALALESVELGLNLVGLELEVVGMVLELLAPESRLGLVGLGLGLELVGERWWPLVASLLLVELGLVDWELELAVVEILVLQEWEVGWKA